MIVVEFEEHQYPLSLRTWYRGVRDQWNLGPILNSFFAFTGWMFNPTRGPFE